MKITTSAAALAAVLAAALLPAAVSAQDAAPAAAPAAEAAAAAAAPDLTQRELVAKLDGDGIGDEGDPDGTGMARLQVDPGAGKLCYDVDYHRVAPVTAAHIHAGARGKSGAPVVPLKLDRDENIKGCAALDRATALALIAEPGDYYVNVHTTELPQGAIRGQLGK
jgi:hypothetical protein